MVRRRRKTGTRLPLRITGRRTISCASWQSTRERRFPGPLACAARQHAGARSIRPAAPCLRCGGLHLHVCSSSTSLHASFVCRSARAPNGLSELDLSISPSVTRGSEGIHGGQSVAPGSGKMSRFGRGRRRRIEAGCRRPCRPFGSLAARASQARDQLVAGMHGASPGQILDRHPPLWFPRWPPAASAFAGSASNTASST